MSAAVAHHPLTGRRGRRRDRRWLAALLVLLAHGGVFAWLSVAPEQPTTFDYPIVPVRIAPPPLAEPVQRPAAPAPADDATAGGGGGRPPPPAIPVRAAVQPRVANELPPVAPPITPFVPAIAPPVAEPLPRPLPPAVGVGGPGAGGGLGAGDGPGTGDGSGPGEGVGDGPARRANSVPPAPYTPRWLQRPTLIQALDADPPQERRRMSRGWASMLCTVQPDGRVRGCRVLEESGTGFGAAAVRVSRWFRISPHTVDGRAAPARVRVLYGFGPLETDGAGTLTPGD